LSFCANGATINAQHPPYLRSTVPTTPPDSSDRRKTNLVYPPIYEALRPFFDRRMQWGSSNGQEVLAYRTLKDHFPELGPQEIFVTIITARQLFRGNSDGD
jgi:hypothetical protein